MYSEEICYCGECGSANKKSAVLCENCGKKIHTKHSAFYDYLKSHIKDELQDRVTDKIYSVIKNYLLSHVYGVVLTVSVVATAASAVTANYQPHIEVVTEMRQPAVQAQAEVQPEIIDLEITDWDIDYFKHVATCYDSLADYLRSYERYWDEDEYYSSPTEIYAEGNVEGYNYTGVHELYNNPITIGQITENISDGFVNQARYFANGSAVNGENLTTELGRKLREEGFEVAEGNFYLVAYDRDVQFDWTQPPPANPTEKLVYRMVFVKYDDKWYLAEDRLTERSGV